MSVLDDFLNKNKDIALKWQDVVSGMLNDVEAYGYAEETLIGIYEYIEENQSITQNQIDAITNIRQKPAHGRRW